VLVFGSADTRPARLAPLELTLELTPRARLDVIDVRARTAGVYGPVLEEYEHCLYCSLHTTAGFLQQNLAARLQAGPQGIGSYIDLFRTIFPEGAGYRHDELGACGPRRTSALSNRPAATRTSRSWPEGSTPACPVNTARTRPPHDLDGMHAGRAPPQDDDRRLQPGWR
jgi:hypothetical protein